MQPCVEPLTQGKGGVLSSRLRGQNRRFEDHDVAASASAGGEQNPAEAPTKAGTRNAQRRQPVLIVDDYPDARATLRDMVEELGLEAVEAEDGQEAFNYLVFHPEQRVQLILLDLDMPRMNGVDFLTLVKSYLRLASIPVLVVSRQAGQLRPEQLRAINGAFQAPYELPRLRAIVEALVSH